MGSKVIFMLLVLCITVYGTNNDDSFSRQKVLEVEKKLHHLRKHSLKTIKVKSFLWYTRQYLTLLNVV